MRPADDALGIGLLLSDRGPSRAAHAARAAHVGRFKTGQIRALNCALALALLCGVDTARAMHATAQPSGDLALLLLNISRYAIWPKNALGKSLTLCYADGNGGQAGDSRSSAVLATAPAILAGASPEPTIRGLPVVWVHISSPRELGGCSAVWLNADVRPAPRAWIAQVADQPVLTMSNYADFASDGGIVGAYRLGADWRFEINLEALHRSKINISAAALRLSQKAPTSTGSAPSTVGAGPPANGLPNANSGGRP